MRAEDLITGDPTVKAVLESLERLPTPEPEKVEALRRRLAATQGPATSPAWPPFLEGARLKRDARYADPPSSHRPVVGPALVMAKRAFRLAFQPFINEALRRQVEFNEAILDALALIHEHQRVQARTQSLWRQEVERQLEQLTSRQPAATSEPSQKPSPEPSQEPTQEPPRRGPSRRRGR
ncbi:hypothetical protein HJC10_14430 [Corallococcus exiguus]|uniref:hypothetical protein n=1 Tax=Corallococcus TaxID=83461 RepID=UPI000ED2A1BF|nr:MULTISPECIES: hypothetical protein [Corallococcus]NNB84923.1 hypothetical protein [Corallococcus exiguus]NNB94066.1 hypothetical protein [Corallococcus exiguus]NNC04039.1 hypothetical protein [Corallococcus exiguus]NPC46824.1 hypothetical protein [Corallococcus exiguus]RKH78331.1 hypothetical protein D7X99_28485 [Corallococcus sp. AB032C]